MANPRPQRGHYWVKIDLGTSGPAWIMAEVEDDGVYITGVRGSVERDVAEYGPQLKVFPSAPDVTKTSWHDHPVTIVLLMTMALIALTSGIAATCGLASRAYDYASGSQP